MNDRQPADVESDDRFTSGMWNGYFLQRTQNAARQKMELELTFCNGRVTGDGRDGVGSFSITGGYETADGKVWWTKRYPRHDVFYKGYAESKGIWGTWEIESIDRDGFHIWPRGANAEDEAGRREQERPITFEDDALTRDPVVAAPL